MAGNAVTVAADEYRRCVGIILLNQRGEVLGAPGERLIQMRRSTRPAKPPPTMIILAVSIRNQLTRFSEKPGHT